MNSLLKIIFVFLAVFVPLGVLHWWVVTHFQIELFYSVWSVYGFHFGLTLLIFGLLYGVHISKIFYTGFAFLGGSMLRMLGSMAFFLPLLLSDEKKGNISEVFSFMIPYFVCLIFEIYYALWLLKKEEKQKNATE